MDGIVGYLEEGLNLPVNKDKSEAAKMKDITFLGFQILQGKIRVSNKARIKFKDKVRELTRRNNPSCPCIRLPRGSMNNSEAGSHTSGLKSPDTYFETWTPGYAVD